MRSRVACAVPFGTLRIGVILDPGFTSGAGIVGSLAAPSLFAAQEPAAGVAAAALPGGGNRVRELVKTLYHGMNQQQKSLVFLPFDHRRRRLLGNNWWVVKPTIGEIYNADQQALMK